MEFPIIDSHTHFPVAQTGYYDQWERTYAARYGAEKLGHGPTAGNGIEGIECSGRLSSGKGPR